jgi:hypothetical protein
MGEGVDEIAVGVLGQALQGHRAAGGIPDQALQLVAPMGRDLGVGVEGKPVDAADRNCKRYFVIAPPVAQSPVWTTTRGVLFKKSPLRYIRG